MADEWSQLGECGLVVGATYPTELADVRSIVGDLPLLVPGVGAQGGDAATVMEHGAGPDGRGLIVNSSRAILYASDGDDFADAARAEALRTAASLAVDALPVTVARMRTGSGVSGQAERVLTLTMPGAARSSSSTAAGTGFVGAISMTALSSSVRLTSMSAMFTSASTEQRADRADHARAVVVRDDDHVVDRRHVEGHAVDVVTRCAAFGPDSVPLILCPPPLTVSRLT